MFQLVDGVCLYEVKQINYLWKSYELVKILTQECANMEDIQTMFNDLSKNHQITT